MIPATLSLLAALAAAAAGSARVTVHVDRPGAPVPPSLYGIFFEEINHAGDGGLYAELIRNRSFEETVPVEGTTLRDGFCVGPDAPSYRTGKNKDWKVEWRFPTPWPAWSLECAGGASAALALATERPVHARNVNYLRLRVDACPDGGAVRLLNDGYWGVAVKQGATYEGAFFARVTAGDGGAVRVGVAAADGRELGAAEVAGVAGREWTRHAFRFAASATDPQARFFLQPPAGVGTLELDVVSLFPQATFKGRANGCRADIAQLLADMRPAFVRFPGGCVVEGATYANRYRWKETIGPIESRPGHWSLWGYRNIDGLGYHEFLQLCEDLGAEGMYVANCGLACEFRNGDYLPEERLDESIRDTLDALEYALGPATSEWGAQRARNGHPAPFPLTYVEIGNENHGPIYNRYYNRFYRALKAAWPQLVLIFNGGTSDIGPGREVEKVEMLDEHYYRDPAWMFENFRRYDRVPRDRGYDVYVGEYAVNRGVGHGNHLAALAEAVFMLGMERNGDIVKLASYAPLLFNVRDIKWPVNLIGFDGATAFGRSSYHAQALFAQHRPDVNLATEFDAAAPAAAAALAGAVGLGAWDTAVEYRELRVEAGGRTVFAADFAQGAAGWRPQDGDWSASDGVYRQSRRSAARLMSWLEAPVVTNATITVKARKRAGSEGFLIGFARRGDAYHHLNLGGFGNRRHTFEALGAKPGPVGEESPGGIEAGRWYDVRIVVGGDGAEGFLDGKRVASFRTAPSARFYAQAGLDRRAGEVVVKVVNAEERPVATRLELRGAATVASAGRVFTLAGRLEEENDVANPRRIAPVESAFDRFGAESEFTFPPASLTILRIRAR